MILKSRRLVSIAALVKAPPCVNCRRGMKTVLRKSLADLPVAQGKPLEPFSEITPKSNRLATASGYPPVIDQALANQKRYAQCVLLTRVGQFYEVYFQQAADLAPLLNIKLATKQTRAGPVPMAGFPFFQLDRYLKILVEQHNRYVAICEEYRRDEEASSTSTEFERRVARVITPGTLIDERFIDPYVHNYLLSISTGDSAEIGLAWLDLSTGDFFTQTTTLSSLAGHLARIAPREVLLDEKLKSSTEHQIFEIIEEEHHFITYESFPSLASRKEEEAQCAEALVTSWSNLIQLPPKSHRWEYNYPEARACTAILVYVHDKLKNIADLRLQAPTRKSSDEYVMMDASTMRALEIKRSLRDGTIRGSLMGSIRRTVTRSGARLLADWLCLPITSIEKINERLDLVEYFLNNPTMRADVLHHLGESYDSQRLVQKFSLGRGESEDLLALARTIEATASIAGRLKQIDGPFERIRERLELPMHLCTRIRQTLDEQGLYEQQRNEEEAAALVMAKAAAVVASASPDQTKSVPVAAKRKAGGDEIIVWVMHKNATENLTKLHRKLTKAVDERAVLEERLQEEYGAPSLALRVTPGLSHILHVRSRDAKLLDADETVPIINSSKSTRSYQHPSWTHLGALIDHTKLMIRVEEQRVFARIRNEVIKHLVVLRRNAAVLDELDIACAFAILAQEQNLVRPRLDPDSNHLLVTDGRHSIVEAGLHERGQMFVPNDCQLIPSERLWLITGPNMGGKSTFLRQNALIAIMAQVGSFVPASKADIGIVDQIFTRVSQILKYYSASWR